jgi:putative flippase GtrA
MSELWQKFKAKFFTKQFLTFGIIGACNTIISQVLYMMCVAGSMEVGLSSIVGDVLSMVFSYFMNMHFTYKQKPSWKSAVTFPLSYLPGITISWLMVLLVVDVFNGPKLWAKLISMPIYIPLNFLCMNLIVRKFGGKKETAVKS